MTTHINVSRLIQVLVLLSFVVGNQSKNSHIEGKRTFISKIGFLYEMLDFGFNCQSIFELSIGNLLKVVLFSSLAVGVFKLATQYRQKQVQSIFFIKEGQKLLPSPSSQFQIKASGVLDDRSKGA